MVKVSGDGLALGVVLGALTDVALGVAIGVGVTVTGAAVATVVTVTWGAGPEGEGDSPHPERARRPKDAETATPARRNEINAMLLCEMKLVPDCTVDDQAWTYWCFTTLR